MAMLHGLGPSAGRVAAIVPAVLLLVFLGLLWLAGLACGKDRRQYVTKISDKAMWAFAAMFQGVAVAELTASNPQA